MKKKFTPEYTIDFNEIKDYDDLVIEMTKKRVDAGKPIDGADLTAYTSAIISKTPKVTTFIIDCGKCLCCEPKKTPWYKRFWNRLKYAFNW